MNANAVADAVPVLSAETLPDGVGVLLVSVRDFDHVQSLPQALDFDGKRYGRTGWNSDSMVAYFRTDARLATPC